MLRSVLTVLTAFTFLLSTAQKLEPKLNVNGKGLWVDGYDPVAYFADNKAVPGKPEYTFTYQGATFRFASQAHLDLFKAAPQKYMPEYGGYCAFAIGDDASKVSVDPKTFKVIDGKVYLFYNTAIINTLKSWNKDELRLLPAADQNWKAMKHKP